jgi:alpha-D-ribose 1-methylphosphonate 5-triphosphate diphosphatase
MWLTNLRVVLPDRVVEHGALHVVEGRIAEIVEGDARAGAGERMIDGWGLIALPGIIDLHGDMVEREIEPRPGALFPTEMAIHELDKRLAATGVTTAYAALSLWDVDRPEGVRGRQRVIETIHMLNRLRPVLLIDHAVHVRYEVSTPSSADLAAELLESREIQLLSLMDHTPGQGQYRNLERYIEYIARYRQVDRGVVERETVERMRRALDGAAAGWELARDLALTAAGIGVPIASHDDDTVEKVDLVARLGATICEFPVTLEAAQEAQQRGMHVVMGAPNVLRGSSHSGNLSAQEAIAAGLVDTLAADYYPAALLHAIFALTERGVLPLYKAAQLVSQNPADALGLHDRGRIAPGCQADVALVEASATPRVRGVLRGGTPIYWDALMAARS